MKTDHRFLARLLSGRSGMSIKEKESALEAVLSHIEREELPETARSPIPVPLHLIKRVSLAALVVVAVPAVLLLKEMIKDDGFIEKGARDELPLFRIKCVDEGGVKDTCRPGNKLVFNVRPPADKMHFSAFARRESDGLIIWYFPDTEAATGLSLADTAEDGILTRGVRIGDLHTSGSYQVFGIFSKNPTTRRELKAVFDDNFGIRDNSYAVSTVFFVTE